MAENIFNDFLSEIISVRDNMQQQDAAEILQDKTWLINLYFLTKMLDRLLAKFFAKFC